MKRWGYLFQDIVSFNNLCEAVHNAAKHKKKKDDVAKFLFYYEKEILGLQRSIIIRRRKLFPPF